MRKTREKQSTALFAAEWPATISVLGFTGTRNGMGTGQHDAVEALLRAWRPIEVHHGDALGADAQFHALVRALLPGSRIVVHPPQLARYRAFCEGDEERTPCAYLTRNRAIVIESEALLATPWEDQETLRSGSWMTARFAGKLHRPVRIVLPGVEKMNTKSRPIITRDTG